MYFLTKVFLNNLNKMSQIIQKYEKIIFHKRYFYFYLTKSYVKILYSTKLLKWLSTSHYNT